jgi:hypothetical protein
MKDLAKTVVPDVKRLERQKKGQPEGRPVVRVCRTTVRQ